MKNIIFLYIAVLIVYLFVLSGCDQIIPPPAKPPSSYIVTAKVEEGIGTIEPDGEMEIESGSYQAFIFQAGMNEAIKEISIDGKPIQGMKHVCYFDFTLNSVNADHIVRAYYRPALITVKHYCGYAGCSTEKTEEFYPNYRIIADTSYETYPGSHQWVPFYEWVVLEGEADIADPKSYDTFIDRICGDTYVAPYYWDGCYTITAACSEGGEIDPSGDICVQPGHDQSFHIQADSGYFIESILTTEGNVENVNGLTEYDYEFNDVNSNKFIFVTFRKTRFTLTYRNTNGQMITQANDFEPDYPISTVDSYSYSNGPTLIFSHWEIRSGKADLESTTSSNTVIHSLEDNTEIYAFYRTY